MSDRDQDHGQKCLAYRRFLEELSPACIDRLDGLASPNIHFHDPLYDLTGRSEVKALFHKMFDEVDSPRFEVTLSSCTGNTCFLRWRFTCRPKFFGQGHPWVVDGITELVYDGAGLVAEHIDYWDAGQYIYERIPLVNVLIRAVKKRLVRVPKLR